MLQKATWKTLGGTYLATHGGIGIGYAIVLARTKKHRRGGTAATLAVMEMPRSDN